MTENNIEQARQTRPRMTSRRFRRGSAVVVTTAIATSLLPVATASAAPTASAALAAASQKVFPGTGEDLTVSVTNSGTRLLGETVNYIDIKLPNTAGFKTRDAAAKIKAPDGWTASRTSIGGIQTYTFRGGSLAPGSSGAFTFPAEVAAPSADRAGTFEVAVSSDNGKTTSGATGSLVSLVQTLEILPTSLRPTGPTAVDAFNKGVTDGTATVGQKITYAFDVKNHASGIQRVTPSLATGNTADKVAQAAALDIASGATRSVTSTVELLAAGGRTFTASAAAGPSVADMVSKAGFDVLAASTLTLTANEFAPKSTRAGISRDFSIPVTKSGTPALRVTPTVKVLLGGVVQVTKPGSALEVLDNTKKTVTVPGVLLPPLADGVFDVEWSFSGVDENGAPFTFSQLLTGALKIDSKNPVIEALTATLPNDADGRQQTAASNNADVVPINGRLAADDCDSGVTVIVTSGAATYTVPVDKPSGSCTFTGRFTTGKDGDITLVEPELKVTAVAMDPAMNKGSAQEILPVDLTIPRIASAQTRGASETSSTVDRIEITFAEPLGVYGACDPSQYSVDGEIAVTQVISPSGDCNNTRSNKRILILGPGAARPQTYQTNVTYSPGTRPFQRPATDGAGLDALQQKIATVVGVIPLAPSLLTVTRNTTGPGAPETATSEGNVYFTRFEGNDLKVTFGNGRADYFIEVLDGTGAVLTSRQLESNADNTVVVPLGQGVSDGSYARALRLRNGETLKSQLTSFTVVLDRAAPSIGQVTKTGDKAVKVSFNEILTAAGSNFAEDWFVSERNDSQNTPGDPSDDFAYYQVGSVSGTGAERSLTTNTTLGNLGALGALYNPRNPDSVRYVDRAGNPLRDTGGMPQ